MVADAMGPGVVRVERNATGGTTLDRNEQSVIAGVAFSGYSGDITIIFSVLRICQIEPPALVIIRCCGTCRILHSGDSARRRSHENSRIHLLQGPHVRPRSGQRFAILLRLWQRTYEIGIRMALGASDWQILGMVLLQGLRSSGIAAAIGIGVALALSGTIRDIVSYAESRRSGHLHRRPSPDAHRNGRRMLHSRSPSLNGRSKRDVAKLIAVRDYGPWLADI